jgi:hypothetical protein
MGAELSAVDMGAKELGPSFESLKFVQGSIENFSLLDDNIDVLIALHACDTATGRGG